MPRKFKSKSTTSARTPKPADVPKRLNQLLASAGFGSRRQCEDLIREGRVDIDGEIVTKLAVTADPKKQTVRVDGNVLRPQKLVYYAVHKPVGVVSTNADPQGRPRVIDLVPPTERVFPVGRLDRSSDGLMLLTNDGDLAQHLAHPKFGIQKVYRVTVAGQVKPETMRKMREGVYIAEGLVQVDGAKILKARPRATDMEIRLREGKNREIRRILARFGHKVQTLRRIAIGPLRLGDIPAGAYHKLTHEEVSKLRKIAEQVENAPPEPPKKRFSKSSAITRPTGSRPTGKRGAAGKPKQVATGHGGSQKRGGQKPGSKAPGKRARSTKTSYPISSERSNSGTVIGGDEPVEKPARKGAAKKRSVKRGANNRKATSGRGAKGGSSTRGGRSSAKPSARGSSSGSRKRGGPTRGKGR